MVALVGTAGDDTLDILEDTTSVQAGDGNDTIVFGLDLTTQTTAFTTGVIDGGGGTQDVLSLQGFVGTTQITNAFGTFDAVVDLASQTFNYGSGTITLAGIERATGSDGNDLLIGATDGDFDGLQGGNGDDYIISSGDGAFMQGGAGADTFDGSVNAGGFSIAAYGFENTEGITIDLNDASLSTGSAAGDTYIQVDEIQATDFDDIFVADTGNTRVRLQAGNDTYIAGFNANGSQTSAFADGGDGVDLLSFENADQGIFVNLNDQANGGGLILRASDFGFIAGIENFENIQGSDFNDNLIGNGGDNIFYSSGGADQFNGDFNSTQNGPAGDGGNDTVSYEFATEGVNASLTGQTTNIDFVVQADRGEAAGDTYANIDNLIGTAFRDFLTGNDEANTLSGGDGSDFLFGNAGDDVLLGGGGIDVLSGGAGADTFDGGDGEDFVDYRRATEGITLDIAAGTATGGEATGDTFISIERFILSNFDDIVMGSADGDIVFGFDGGDTIGGMGGNDTLLGGGGDDNLFGGEGNDTLIGDAGSDFLDGGNGFDVAYGGAGADTFNFASAEAGRMIIGDFSSADGDVMDVSGYFADGIEDFSDITERARDVGIGTVIQLDADSEIFLLGVALEDLMAGDFAFGGMAV